MSQGFYFMSSCIVACCIHLVLKAGLNIDPFLSSSAVWVMEKIMSPIAMEQKFVIHIAIYLGIIDKSNEMFHLKEYKVFLTHYIHANKGCLFANTLNILNYILPDSSCRSQSCCWVRTSSLVLISEFEYEVVDMSHKYMPSDRPSASHW